MTPKEVHAWFLKLIVLTGLVICLCVMVSRHRGLLSSVDEALPVMAEREQIENTGGGASEAEESAAAEDISEDISVPEETAVPAEPTPIPKSTPLPEFTPERSVSPVITGTSISVDGSLRDSYSADEAHTMDFGLAEDYTDVKGIVTFRGNNFRNTAQYGLAEISAQKFGESWRRSTDGLSDNSGGYWAGCGWTGQPLIVEWPAETKRIMNMYDWAKEKEGLVEVIYCTLDGYVYFLDLETGENTRDRLFLGWSFKGAGALDPRGYPLLYVGGGLFNGSGAAPRVLIVSLIDGEILYTMGDYDSFAPRPSWSAFDSSALVDAETDQLIYPGENGVIYIEKLNTQYDEAAGTISIDPEEIKFTFTSSSAEEFYYGMEDSAIAWRGHLFIADNGGDFICLDLNTLEIEWRFDCLDDTNCTGVLELDETGHPYIYLSTSFHLGWRSWTTATIPVWKIDAVTGQEVWHRDYTCYSEDGLSGGVQGSLALGSGELDGILYVAMARYPNGGNGQLLALDTETGDELWTYTSDSYAWSSPTCFYDTNGRGYVLYASCIQGKLFWLDGKDGTLLDSFPFNCTAEASPVVYNDTVVMGTRNSEIYGIRLT